MDENKKKLLLDDLLNFCQKGIVKNIKSVAEPGNIKNDILYDNRIVNQLPSELPICNFAMAGIEFSQRKPDRWRMAKCFLWSRQFEKTPKPPLITVFFWFLHMTIARFLVPYF